MTVCGAAPESEKLEQEWTQRGHCVIDHTIPSGLGEDVLFTCDTEDDARESVAAHNSALARWQVEAQDQSKWAHHYLRQLESSQAEAQRLREALKPFAAAAKEVHAIGAISREDQWLWKPSSNKRETAGISAQHCIDAAEALNPSPAPEGAQ